MMRYQDDSCTLGLESNQYILEQGDMEDFRREVFRENKMELIVNYIHLTIWKIVLKGVL